MRFLDGRKIRLAVGIEEAVHHVLPAFRGEVDRQALLPDRLLDSGEHRLEIGVFRVDAVDHDHAAEVALRRPFEHAVRGELDSGLGIHHDHRRLDRGERADRLPHEIRRTGRIDQVDVDVLPGEVDERRVERVLVLLFQRIEIADGVAFLDASGRADRSGLDEQSLRERGFARAGVAHQRCSTNGFRRILGHADFPPLDELNGCALILYPRRKVVVKAGLVKTARRSRTSRSRSAPARSLSSSGRASTGAA